MKNEFYCEQRGMFLTDCVIEPKLSHLLAVANAARTARYVLEQMQESLLPRSHNVRVALAKLTDALDALDDG